MLSALRLGHLDERYIATLQGLSRPVVYDDGILPSQLFALRADVEGFNKKQLEKLEGNSVTYEGMDYLGYDVEGIPLSRSDGEKLFDRLIALPTLQLKVSWCCILYSRSVNCFFQICAQVMLIKVSSHI